MSMHRSLLLLLLSVALLVPGTALAQGGGDPLAINPATLTLKGTRGAQPVRTILVTTPDGLPPRIVAEDLARSDGGAVLPALAVRGPEAPAPAEDAENAGADAQAALEQPQQLAITFDLRGVPSGSYSGTVYIISGDQEQPLTVTVEVKDRAFWPFVVLLLGVALGLGLTLYRRRGQPRDQILVEMGRVQRTLDGAPDLAADQPGAPFRTAVEAALVDVETAVRTEKWEEARTALGQADALLAKWRKSKQNWLQQLRFAQELADYANARRNVTYLAQVAEMVESAVNNAPERPSPAAFRTELGKLDLLVDRYEQLSTQLTAMQRSAENNLEGDDLVTWTETIRTLRQRLDQLRPLDGATFEDDLQAVATAVDDEETKLANAVTAAQAKAGEAKDIMPTPQAAGMGEALRRRMRLPDLLVPVQADTGEGAALRLRIFLQVSYAVAVILLAGAGFNELYVDSTTFGQNAWGDYFALFAWGFGAEATRSAVTDVLRMWDVPNMFEQEES